MYTTLLQLHVHVHGQLATWYVIVAYMYLKTYDDVIMRFSPGVKASDFCIPASLCKTGIVRILPFNRHNASYDLTPESMCMLHYICMYITVYNCMNMYKSHHFKKTFTICKNLETDLFFGCSLVPVVRSLMGLPWPESSNSVWYNSLFYKYIKRHTIKIEWNVIFQRLIWQLTYGQKTVHVFVYKDWGTGEKRVVSWIKNDEGWNIDKISP